MPSLRQRLSDEQHIERVLASAPLDTGGVHHWLYKAAHELLAHKSELEIVNLLYLAVQDYPARKILRHEVTESVRCAKRDSLAALDGTPEDPEVTKEKRFFREIKKLSDDKSIPHRLRKLKMADKGECPLAALKRLSPSLIPPQRQLLEQLFPNDPLICMGRSLAAAITAPLSKHNLDGKQFIVPNPMTAKTGLTKHKDIRQRSRDNTGEQIYVVVEADFPILSKEDQIHFGATLLIRMLALGHKLCVVVHSGNKSIHGWFRVGTQHSKHDLMRAAATMGADTLTFRKEQWVRLPGGTRDNPDRTHQSVLYYDSTS